MIKITHIEKNEEQKIINFIFYMLKIIYPYYFEVKYYGNGESSSPTIKLVNKKVSEK